LSNALDAESKKRRQSLVRALDDLDIKHTNGRIDNDRLRHLRFYNWCDVNVLDFFKRMKDEGIAEVVAAACPACITYADFSDRVESGKGSLGDTSFSDAVKCDGFWSALGRADFSQLVELAKNLLGPSFSRAVQSGGFWSALKHRADFISRVERSRCVGEGIFKKAARCNSFWCALGSISFVDNYANAVDLLGEERILKNRATRDTFWSCVGKNKFE
jgi:hypothetical protein